MMLYSGVNLSTLSITVVAGKRKAMALKMHPVFAIVPLSRAFEGVVGPLNAAHEEVKY